MNTPLQNNSAIKVLSQTLIQFTTCIVILLSSILYLTFYLAYLLVEDKAVSAHHYSAVCAFFFLIALLTYSIGRDSISFALEIVKEFASEKFGKLFKLFSR